jgi:hypothetical protein
MWNRVARFAERVCFLSLMFAVVSALPVSAQSVSGQKSAQSAAPKKVAQKVSPERAKEEEEGPDFVRERQEYFMHQRAYPLAHIPQGARLRALEQMRAMPAGSLATPAWEALGPKPILPAQGNSYWGSPSDSGRVTALAFDPTGHDTIYAGAAEGGVWKTTNGGTLWTPLTDSQPSLAVGSIALDPTNSQTIYVGTGEENFNYDAYYGAGILKSTNGGSTWTQMGGTYFASCFAGAGALNSTGSFIGAIAVDPGNNQTVLAGVSGCPYTTVGVYRSADGGSTWTYVLQDSAGRVAGTSIVFVGSGVAYAALSNTNGDSMDGVYKSTDGGQTWTATNGTGTNVLPSGTSVGRIALTAAPSNPLVLYAVITSPTGFTGLYTTIDGGQNWTKTTAPDICVTQCFYDIAVAVSPTNSSIVYAAGIYTYKTNSPTTVVGSTDGGKTWTQVGSSTKTGSTTAVHTDIHALAFSADAAVLAVGGDGGVWKTSDSATPGTLNWTGTNNTLATAQFYPGFAYDGQSDALGGMQDNGSAVLDPKSLKWSNVQCGDGGFSAIDTTTNPYTFYAACGNNVGVSMSTTPSNPASWTVINTGINFTDPTLFIPPFVKDPSVSGTLYYGTNQIYQTTNNGSSWASISPQPLAGPTSTGTVSAIAVAPSNSATIYAGTSDSQVLVTTTGGVPSTAWTNVTGTGLLPPRYVTHITINPTNPATAYATFSGFSGFGDTLGHVFVTTNTGGTWTDISGNLPNIPVNDLVIDPALANTFYAATDTGVFMTSNGGTSWSTYGTGLPNVVVHSLVLEPNARKLAAATHGRSAWRIDAAPATGVATVTLSTASLTFPLQVVNTTSAAQTVTLTVTGTLALSITSIKTDSTDYAVTTTCALAPATNAAGTSCTLGVTYTPTKLGTNKSTIRIADNASGGVTTIAVMGTSTLDLISPTSLTFNYVFPVQTGPPQNVTLTNNSTTATLHIKGIAIVGDINAEFSQTNNCPASVAPTASCTVAVTFAGNLCGLATANLQITDDGTNGAPQIVPLSGTLTCP